MTDRGRREGEPAAVQARQNAERAERTEPDDTEERDRSREGERAAEQARENPPS